MFCNHVIFVCVTYFVLTSLHKSSIISEERNRDSYAKARLNLLLLGGMNMLKMYSIQNLVIVFERIKINYMSFG